MITRVTGKNLKGQTFEQALAKRTLLVGPNGSGKTSRTLAALLAILGYMPGANKTPAGVFETFAGQGASELFAGIEVDGKLLERGFRRQGSGTTTKLFKIDRMTAKADEFAASLARADVSVVDLADFTAASDAKKIDWLFKLYSKGGNLAALDQQIEDKDALVKALDRKAREAEGTVSRLVAAKASVQLPAGTLAEKRAQIADREAQLEAARKALREAEIETARQEEREKAQATPEPAQTAQGDLLDESLHKVGEFMRENMQPAVAPVLDPVASLHRIQDAMAKAGCSACAAGLVLKGELRRIQKEAA
ncbi:hypothetical protein PCS_02598 [Desulfocurvibacter africanus PCS]|uniref:Uncharacterized protein n=1 Tax=Desulfocurvibacter africanus PCS TaxID=1262666 RepID=M5Q0C6_DESAF|nr:ATP-binding protein [Desulfocurvibacter africanus]EMG36586.1 hypothetical protein PCS_02598 [Desulfocurvibacter africanus PCS]